MRCGHPGASEPEQQRQEAGQPSEIKVGSERFVRIECHTGHKKNGDKPLEYGYPFPTLGFARNRCESKSGGSKADEGTGNERNDGQISPVGHRNGGDAEAGLQKQQACSRQSLSECPAQNLPT